MKKSSLPLLDAHYDTPTTSLLVFHFEPHLFESTAQKLKNCTIIRGLIEGKEIYILDDFFEKTEEEQLREFSKKTTFSRNSYGSPEAIESGEKPARSMNGKERWQFFSSPPPAVKEVYQLFGLLSHLMKAEITTQPWELSDRTAHGSPAVIANFVEEASFESMELGKHQDSNPEKNVPFGVPILYAQKEEFHGTSFINGDEGKPWLVSVMLYSRDVSFLSEFGLGTAFYKPNGEMALKVDCKNMRLVFFEGDILHSIEESHIPDPTKTWRVSYVFKLIINPKKKEQNLKKDLQKALKKCAPKFDPFNLLPLHRQVHDLK